MCQYNESVLVNVKIPVDLSCDGKSKWKLVKIDKCIAPIVKALQDSGINMRGSCCGHGIVEGDIQLQDGRMLLILDKKTAREFMTKRTKEKGRFWGLNMEV